MYVGIKCHRSKDRQYNGKTKGTNIYLQNTEQKIKVRANCNPLKTMSEPSCFERANRSCFTHGTRRVTIVTNPVKNHEWGKMHTLYHIMLRKLRQWWSTIPPISTKQTITSHLNLLNTKTQDIWRWETKLLYIPKEHADLPVHPTNCMHQNWINNTNY